MTAKILKKIPGQSIVVSQFLFLNGLNLTQSRMTQILVVTVKRFFYCQHERGGAVGVRFTVQRTFAGWHCHFRFQTKIKKTAAVPLIYCF